MKKNKQKEVMTFHFPESKQPGRNVLINGLPWFVAKDVCDILGHTNPTVALQMLDDDEKAIATRVSDPKLFLGSPGREGREGGAQSLSLVNESGLYALIFRSNKPAAKTFRKWVTSEVLPSIRRTGRYEMPVPDGPPKISRTQTYNMPDFMEPGSTSIRREAIDGTYCVMAMFSDAGAIQSKPFFMDFTFCLSPSALPDTSGRADADEPARIICAHTYLPASVELCGASISREKNDRTYYVPVTFLHAGRKRGKLFRMDFSLYLSPPALPAASITPSASGRTMTDVERLPDIIVRTNLREDREYLFGLLKHTVNS
ncbi:MAG: Bro-N domain-containing protein [Dysgonamonadaceae bacterium]|jgi:prophage antirepressor-like protein|nr:Bro-N domain-containing protein [Dysgonamonadaceae bacterium]